MAGNANVELIRRVYDAFSKGDMEVLNRVFADDIVFRVPGRSPMAGEYRSKEATFGVFGQLSERSGGTFGLDVRNVLGEDELVLALVTVHGERDGKTYNQDAVHAWRVVNGRAVELRNMPADQHAEDEFWS